MHELINVLVPDWPVSAKVTVFTTTRTGGVSRSPFQSLNLGLHVGDDPTSVLENRRRLRAGFALPGEPGWLKQSHGTSVCCLDSQTGPESPPSADGAFTQRAGLVLGILTADCLPVVLCDAAGTSLAVIHAGWRGLAAGILSNAVAQFTADSSLHAWLGPAIGPQVFEVGDDVREAFVQRHDIQEQHFASRDKPGKYLADLYGLARTELTDLGVESISGGDYCTYSQPEWFHSHRRDGVRSGRMATIAWIHD